MKISTIPQIYRNLKRGTEILSVLSKYGLADWVSRLNVDMFKNQLKSRNGEVLAKHTQEQRIRMALTELGPTFIKLGQLLSTRPDQVGVKLADELKALQANVPGDPPARVRGTVESELGQSLEELFAEFDELPLASASIGQVHTARLRSGEPVVVKVQRHGIEQTIRVDLEVLAGLAQLAERIPELAPYRPKALVAEMARTLRRELDFGREERNLLQFATMFETNPTVRIPRPFSELCTPRVLAMDRVEGIKLLELDRLVQEGYDLEEVARRGAELYLEMIFTHGFYHADPHPGNILLLPGNVIGLLDFGMVGRIDERLREDIEEMLLAIVRRDDLMVISLIKRIGSVPVDLDDRALAADVADFVGHYGTQSLERFDMSGALRDMVEIIHRYRILLPPQVSLLIKALVTLEGTTRLLCPKFSLMEVMLPFHRRVLLRRLSPARQFRKLRRIYLETEQLVEILPRRIIDILDQVQAGKFDVHLDHRGLGPSVNRLVLGMLASALFLGSSWMLANEVPPLLFPDQQAPYIGLYRLSVLGLSGCLASIVIGLQLVRAIGKTGHLDRKE